MAIPLMITGGFHVDGFMDTMDAFHSYQEKEQKLNILKDSHIGAFAAVSYTHLAKAYESYRIASDRQWRSPWQYER